MTKQSAPRPAVRRRTSGALTLDYGFLPALLGYRLRVAQLALFRDFEVALGDLGLSPGRVGVLVLVDANPGVSQIRLAEAIGLDRSSLVPVLDRLARAGLLERRPGPDRRTNGLWLTPAGRRLLQTVKRRVRSHESRVAAGLSAAERATLMTLLDRIARGDMRSRRAS